MAPRSKRNGKIDEEIEETFPASDPPAFMGGEVLGAPKGRRGNTGRKATKTIGAKHGTGKKRLAAAKKEDRATKKKRAR